MNFSDTKNYMFRDNNYSAHYNNYHMVSLSIYIFVCMTLYTICTFC